MMKSFILSVIFIISFIFIYKYFFSQKAELSKKLENGCLTMVTKDKRLNNSEYKPQYKKVCSCIADIFFNKKISKSTLEVYLKYEDESYAMMMKSLSEEDFEICYKKSGLH